MSTKEPRFHGEVTEKSHKNMSKIRGKDILKDTEQCVRVIEETIFDQKLEEVDDEEEM